MEIVTVDGVQYVEFTTRPKDSDLHVKTYIYNFWEKSLRDIPANYNYKPSFKEWMLRQRLQYSLPRGPNGAMLIYSELGRPLRPSDLERTDLAVLQCDGKERDTDFDPETWDVEEDETVYHVDKIATYNSFLDVYEHPDNTATKIVYRVPEMDDTQTQPFTRPFKKSK